MDNIIAKSEVNRATVTGHIIMLHSLCLPLLFGFSSTTQSLSLRLFLECNKGLKSSWDVHVFPLVTFMSHEARGQLPQ